jgi:protein tyrosine/serine phosphatase
MVMRRTIQTCWLLLFLVLGHCTRIHASLFSSAPHRRDCNPSSITQKEVPNFHYVDNDLYRGGHPSCAGLLKLEALGIRSIVDLGGGAAGSWHHCKSARRADLRVFQIKISVPDLALLGISDEKLRMIFAMMQGAPKPIFLSCSLGRDRTGLIVALYRMKRGEMSFQEAREEAIYYGYRPRFIGLREALERYQNLQELRLLPAPARNNPPPGTVCRAKALLTSARRF